MILETDIYHISEGSFEDKDLLGKAEKGLLLIARSSDLDNGGKEKLAAILSPFSFEV